MFFYFTKAMTHNNSFCRHIMITTSPHASFKQLLIFSANTFANDDFHLYLYIGFVYLGGILMTKKLVMIDGNSLLFRAFYALPLLNNDKGVYTNAVYGFT